LVMGLNGAGKTSLLRIIADESQPTSGSFRLGHNASLGYYAQEHEGIRAGVPVLAHMREQSDADERVLRALLGSFNLTGDIARQDAGTLSGGEKRRSSRSLSSWRGATTCSCWTSRPTTSIHRLVPESRGRSRSGRGR